MNNEKELSTEERRKLIDALIELSRNLLHTTNDTSEEAISSAVKFNSKNPNYL